MLRVYEEKSIMQMYLNGEFWSGAKTNLDWYKAHGRLEEVCDFIENYFNDCYENCVDITTINDFIWFDVDDLFLVDEE